MQKAKRNRAIKLTGSRREGIFLCGGRTLHRNTQALVLGIPNRCRDLLRTRVVE